MLIRLEEKRCCLIAHPINSSTPIGVLVSRGGRAAYVVRSTVEHNLLIPMRGCKKQGGPCAEPGSSFRDASAKTRFREFSQALTNLGRAPSRGFG
jgi:hypothetical protein